jgi:hypothetical protein
MLKLTLAGGAVAVSLVLVLGLYLLAKGVRNVQLAAASAHWPSVPGKIVSSETTRSVTSSRQLRDQRPSVIFSTRTLIAYSIDDHAYTTDTLYFGRSLGSDDKSEAVLQRLRFPAGKEVTVFYNPANPAVAVLKPGFHVAALSLVGVGLAFILPALLCFYVGLTMARTLPTQDDAFAKSVEDAIEQARRDPRAPLPDIPPPRAADSVMPVAGALFGAVMCGLGVLALSAGAQRVWHGYASLSWPTVPGVVVSAMKGGGENGEDAPDDTTDIAAYARFVYRYEVAGVTHFNNLRRFAQVEGGSSQEADRIAQRYRMGAAVKVCYFPADPDISVLEPGNTGDSLWMPGIGIVLLIGSAAIFVWMVPALAKF